MTDGPNALLDEAYQIGQPVEPTEDATTTPGAPGPAAVAEPNPGSFERFMTSFGAPSRWAGR
jgi:hypothetical protein